MATRPVGMVSDLSDAAAPSEERIQLDPVSQMIAITDLVLI